MLIVVAALAVRVIGLEHGAPHWLEQDAFVALRLEQVRAGADEHPDTAHRTHYPSLLTDLGRLLPAASAPDADAPLDEHLAAARTTFVQVRWIVLLLSLLVVPGAFFLARRFVSDDWALFAGAVCAASLLHLNFSQQARPHAAVTSLMILGLLAALRLRRRPTVGAYVFAGVAAAAAVGCLHSGMTVLLPILCAHALRAGGAARARVWIPLAGVAVGIGVFYRFLFDPDIRSSSAQFRVESGAIHFTHHTLRLGDFDGGGLSTVLRALWSWEPGLSLLLALTVGLALMARARPNLRPTRRSEPGDLAVVLSFAVPYLVALCIYRETYERFLLPLLPVLACGVAWGGSVLVASARRAAPRRAVWALFVLAGVVAPASASIRLAWLRSQPDTLELAAGWVRENVEPGGERVHLVAPIDLPLARTEESLARTTLYSPWARYQARATGGLGAAPLYAIEWLVMRNAARLRIDPEGMRTFLDDCGPGVYVVRTRVEPPPVFALFAEELARRADSTHRFSPDEPPSDFPLYDQDLQVEGWPHVWRRVLTARAVGPVVDVFRLR